MEWIILAILVAGLVFYVITIYNTLVSLKNEFKNSFAQVEVQLKRRYDLIPNLVETAKGYLKHERETLESVIKARNTALSGLEAVSKNLESSSAMSQLAEAENLLKSELGKLNIVVEDYPELKANENMIQLAGEITLTENKISGARQQYNNSATNFNIYRNSFPNNLLAPKFGHQHDAMLLEFKDSEQIQEAPKVSF